MRAFALFAALIAATAFAQSNTAPAAPATVPDGTRLQLKLESELNTKSAKIGQEIKFTAVEAIKDANGAVVNPVDARIVGVVTQAVPFKKGGEAKLSLRLVRMEHGGRVVPLNAFMSAKPLRPGAGGPKVVTMMIPGVVSGPIRPDMKPDLSGVDLGPGGAPPNTLAQVKLQYAADPAMKSELVSKEGNIVLLVGTTVIARQVVE